MQYTWQCRVCGVRIVISRPLSMYSVGPTTEEICMCADKPEWERILDAVPIATGDGYKP